MPKRFFINKLSGIYMRWVITVISVTSLPAAYTFSQSSNRNYTAVYIATAPITDSSAVKTKPLSDVKVTISYTDGSGHSLQTVAKQGSLETATGQGKDLISFTTETYRRLDQFLPYPASGTDGSYRANALADQTSFYTSAASPLAGQNENYFYAETQYEASPDNSRPVKSLAPGTSWAGADKGIQQQYYFNKASESVKQWMVTEVNTPGSGFAAYSIVGAFGNNTLYKNISIDENGKQVITYTGSLGQTILKKVQFTATADNGSGSGYDGWICTYYIYDDAGKLRCVIQPEGVKSLTTNGWSLTPDILNGYCFRYEYDSRGLLIMKKAPGSGEIHILYDAKSRQVAIQDANMRNNAQWMVSLYDNSNRPIETASYVDNTDFPTLLTQVASTASFAPSGTAVLTQTHYDDYTGLPSGLSAALLHTWDSYLEPASATTYPYPEQPVQNSSITTKGMPVWTSKAILDSSPVAILPSAAIYDDKGRLIQSQSKNITGGTDVTTIQYTWAGQPYIIIQKTENARPANAQTTVVVTRITYDNLGRVVKTEMRQSNTTVNNGAMSDYATISEVQYNALGQIVYKKLGRQRTSSGDRDTIPLETQTLDYNIRGWLLGVNRAYTRDAASTNDRATTIDGDGEMFTESGQDVQTVTYPNTNYFGFDLGYDKTDNNLIGGQSYAAPQYNGNIAGMVWKNAYDMVIRRYDFNYDAVNRLTEADYLQYTNTTPPGQIWNPQLLPESPINSTGIGITPKPFGEASSFNNGAGVDYSMSACYDGNGNIKKMQQKGLLSTGSSQTIDDLTYSYQSNSNKLLSVTDAAPDDAGENLGDFQDGNTTSNDYAYDANGNLIQDLNKNISSITYNYLNLPEVITVAGKGSIYYTYDAAGNKLSRKTVDNASGKVTLTTYIGSSVYQQSTPLGGAGGLDTLQFFGTPEGRARISPSGAGGFVYDYFLKDHLGNTRVVITDDYNVASPILEVNSYYPFGLEMKNIGLQAMGNAANRYKFNGGTELNNDLGINYYETMFRSLDPQLGRFWQIDPLAGETSDVSPYAFVGNNPLMFIDPIGLEDSLPYAGATVTVTSDPPWWTFLNGGRSDTYTGVDLLKKPRGLQSIPGLDGTYNQLGDVVVSDKAKPKPKRIVYNQPLITREKVYEHPITTARLFTWYSLTGGELYVPDDKTLQKLFDDIKKAGLIDAKYINPVDGYPGLYYKGIDANNTDYHYSLGQFTMYFLKAGDTYIPVGMSDYYNFDKQNRGTINETLTTFGRWWFGTYFDIRGGITPDQDYIDNNYKK